MYDKRGKYIKEIKLDKAIIENLENERVSTFDVSGSYIFLRIFSGTGMLCDISTDTAKLKFIDSEDLNVAYGAISEEEPTNILIYSNHYEIIGTYIIRDKDKAICLKSML